MLFTKVMQRGPVSNSLYGSIDIKLDFFNICSGVNPFAPFPLQELPYYKEEANATYTLCSYEASYGINYPGMPG